MNKCLLSALIIFSIFSFNASAARNTEIYDYKRASDLGFLALKNQSYDVAFRHLDEASKLGNKVAQYSLALLYMKGEGVSQDFTQAYLWLNVASEVKERKWRKLRDKVHNALSKKQQNQLKPHIDIYMKKYGAKAQEVSCYKRAITGSNIKSMQCSKHLDSI